MDDFEEKIDSLQKEVNQISSSNTSTINNSVKKETKQFDFNFNMLNSGIVRYVILPFLILIVLFTWKPSLLLNDNTDERKLNNKKLIVATIVLTISINTIIIIGDNVYKNKTPN